MDLSAVANVRTIKERPGLFQKEEESDLADELITKHLPEVAQREINQSHAKDLAYFILQACFHAVNRRAKRKGFKLSKVFEDMHERVGHLIFAELSPFVANIRGTPRIDKENNLIWLSAADIIWTIDGQHRLVGSKMLADFLKDVLETRKYKKNGLYHPGDHDEATTEEIQVWEMILSEFRRSEVTIQVNLNLDLYEERSSFHFLNNFQKPVKPELSLPFDKSNPINEFSDELMRKDDLKGKITQESLVAINSILFTKKTGMKGARPADIQDKRSFAYKFWEKVLEIPNVLEKTSVAQPVVLKALASVAFTLHKSGDLANLATLFSEIPKFDFSHTNPLWRYFMLSDAELRSTT